MLSPDLAALVGAARRYWILIAVTAVVGALVAIAFTTNGGVLHTGTAVITVDGLSLGRLPAIVNADTALRHMQAPEFAERLADASGVTDVATVSAALNSYTTGLPPQEIRLTYTADDAETAETMALAAGELAIERIAQLNSVERDRQQAIADKAASTLAALESTLPDAEGQDRTSNVVGSWSVENGRINAEYQLALIDGAYTLESPVTVAAVTQERATARNGIGGGLIGLVLGIGIALVRDRIGGKA